MTENFLMIAQQVLILFILIGIGFLCGKKGILTESSSHHITDIVLYVVTPCVMITAFQRKFTFELLESILIATVCAALIISGSILIANLALRDKSAAREKVLRFATVFSNCGFMSLPLQKAVLGDDGWFYGSIFVAVFNIFVWTYGLISMSDKSDESDKADNKTSISFYIKKLVFNPGIMGALTAIILFVCRVDLPYIIRQPADYLAALNTPLPMLIIGFYLSQANLKKAFTDAKAYIAMVLRLIVIPVAAAAAMILCKVDKTIIIAFIIASSAPTAATTTMFSAKFKRDTELSVSIVAATTVLSIITMPLVVALAGALA